MNGQLDRNVRTVHPLEKIIEKQEARAEFLHNSAYQLANFYLVFQGVVLAALSQANTLKCELWWIPFLLSLLSSLVTVVPLVRTLVKHKLIKEEIDRNRISLFTQDTNNRNSTRTDPISSLKKNFYIIVVSICLICFSVLMLVACKLILCKNGSEKTTCPPLKG